MRGLHINLASERGVEPHTHSLCTRGPTHKYNNVCVVCVVCCVRNVREQNATHAIQARRFGGFMVLAARTLESHTLFCGQCAIFFRNERHQK